MAANFVANIAEKVVGPVPTDTTKGLNPANEPETLADPSGEKMMALAW